MIYLIWKVSLLIYRKLKDIVSERVSADTTVGSLIIYEAHREDSGNYTCSPSNLDSASVQLHVLNGESISQIFLFFTRDQFFTLFTILFTSLMSAPLHKKKKHFLTFIW